MLSPKPLRRLLCFGLLVTAAEAAAASTVVTAGYKVPTPVTVAPGQIITFFVHGLAANLNAPVRAEGTPLPTLASFTIAFDHRQNALASRPQIGVPADAETTFVGLTPGYVGLYQVNVVVPSAPANGLPCYPVSRFNGIQIDSNVTINLGGRSSFDGVGICVQPSERQ